VGAEGSGNQMYWTGSFCDLAVCTRNLTAAEITSLSGNWYLDKYRIPMGVTEPIPVIEFKGLHLPLKKKFSKISAGLGNGLRLSQAEWIQISGGNCITIFRKIRN